MSFLNAQDSDTIKFDKDTITLLLINLEQDEVMRQDNPFLKKHHTTGKNPTNASSYTVHPEIRLNIYLLFVANWDDYITGLDHLSLIIRFFQANRVFTQDKFPDLGKDAIEKLTIELITLPFAQQNEVWNALRTTYRPSVLFKVRMIVFSQDISNASPLPQITTIDEKFYQGLDNTNKKEETTTIKRVK